MVSISHPNSAELFARDLNGLVKFFAMKMHYIPPDTDICKLFIFLSTFEFYMLECLSKLYTNKINMDMNKLYIGYVHIFRLNI